MKGLLLFVAIFFACGFLIFTFASCQEFRMMDSDSDVVVGCGIVAAISLILALIFLLTRKVIDTLNERIRILETRVADWKAKMHREEERADRWKADFADLARDR